MTAPAITEPGVHFGMDEDAYHAAFALSSSGIKHLRASPLNFWASSVLNPLREDSDTEAKTIGKAYDKRIVEGAKAFYAEYAPALDPKDYPNALRTNEDLKEALAKCGQAVKGAPNKAKLIEALEQADPSVQIWERIASAHGAKHAGRILLAPWLIQKIEIAAAMIEKHPQLGKAFSGGYPQVSVFWTDEESGVPCKARFDYLKRAAIVDLKTFENVHEMPIKRAIARSIANYKYHIQARFYLDAVQEARKLISAGAVHGEVEQPFLDAIVGNDEHKFMFLFQQKGPAPIAQGWLLPEMTLGAARVDIEDAKRVFKENWDHYGADPWLDRSEVQTFDPTDFPLYLTD